MLHVTRIAAISLFAIVLSGCVVSIGGDEHREDKHWHQDQERNERYIAQAQLGTSVNLIVAELGEAHFKDSFQRNGDLFDVLYYRTHHRHSDGKTTRDETTPLVFVDGVLVGYGDSAVVNATR